MMARWKTAAMLLALASLGGCDSKREAPSLDKAWVRLPAVPGRPAVAYFVLKAGGLPQEITQVKLDVSGKAEMHETMAKGAMSTMAPLARLEVPAATSVTFAPGGRHVMLFDLDPAVKPGSRIEIEVGNAAGIARVVGAGDPAPY